jgi:hypothetical protein
MGSKENFGKFCEGMKSNLEHFSLLQLLPNRCGFRIIEKVPSQSWFD